MATQLYQFMADNEGKISLGRMYRETESDLTSVASDGQLRSSKTGVFGLRSRLSNEKNVSSLSSSRAD